MYFFHILFHLLRKKQGFFHQEQLPQGAFTAHNLPSLPSRWFCTDDFKHLARNHCAAVCVMNVLLYFRQKCPFECVHRHIGNGPVFSLRKAKAWFSLHKIHSVNQLESALSFGQPCAMMVSTPRHDWHWVLVTGIREYPNGSCWLQIADGWHSEDVRFCRLEREHDWLSCIALELRT